MNKGKIKVQWAVACIVLQNQFHWIKGSFQCLVLVQPMMLAHLTVLVYETIEFQVVNFLARNLLLKFLQSVDGF